MKNTIIFMMLVSLFGLFNVNLLLAEQSKEDIAIQAAKDWLFLVDLDGKWRTSGYYIK